MSVGRRPWLALALCGAYVACESPADVEPVDAAVTDAASREDAAEPLREVALLDHSAWSNYPAELDPLASHQPAQIACGISGWFVERNSLEVDTGQCNYLLVEHPALVDVPEGSQVDIELWHFDLVAEQPATAHIALLFDDALQWETEVAIPGPGNLQQVSVNATRALAKGEPIRFHLHNHGQNTWLLGDVHVWIR